MKKTSKSISKRFKVTGTGKVMRRTPGQRHRLRLRNTKQKRRSMHDKEAAPGVARMVRQACPAKF